MGAIRVWCRRGGWCRGCYPKREVVDVQLVVCHIVGYGETIPDVRVGLRPAGSIRTSPCIATDEGTTDNIYSRCLRDIPRIVNTRTIDEHVVSVIEVIVIDCISATIIDE